MGSFAGSGSEDPAAEDPQKAVSGWRWVSGEFPKGCKKKCSLHKKKKKDLHTGKSNTDFRKRRSVDGRLSEKI